MTDKELEEIERKANNPVFSVDRADAYRLLAEVKRLCAVEDSKIRWGHAKLMDDLDAALADLAKCKAELNQLRIAATGYWDEILNIETALRYDKCKGEGHTVTIERIVAENARLREAALRVQREYYEWHEPDGSGEVSQNAIEKLADALLRGSDG